MEEIFLYARNTYNGLKSFVKTYPIFTASTIVGACVAKTILDRGGSGAGAYFFVMYGGLLLETLRLQRRYSLQ